MTVEPALSAFSPYNSAPAESEKRYAPSFSKPSAGTSDPILSLRGVSLSFGGVTAVSDIDLDVAQGEIRAIIGPNGAGKSSLINLISGLYRPSKGTIAVAGQVFSAVPAGRVAKLGIARTYQNLALFKGLTVLENIIAGRSSVVRSTFIEQVLGTSRSRREEADARRRAQTVIEALHLESVQDRHVGTLPYGVQKRVELARALVAEPKIILLDEPMAGMTAADKREMAQFVLAARDAFNATIVLIEHDIGIVMGISDRVAVLDYGRKIADGEPEVVRADRRVIDAYLGVIHDDDVGVQSR